MRDDTRLVPASGDRVVRCPKCGSGHPVVQAMYEVTGRERLLINCCTRCHITGRIVTVQAEADER